MVSEKIASFAISEAQYHRISGDITPESIGYEGKLETLKDDIKKDFGLKGWGKAVVGTEKGPVNFLFTMPPYSINPQMYYYFAQGGTK